MANFRGVTDGAVGAGIVLVLLPGIALFSFTFWDPNRIILEIGLPVVAIFGIMILFGSMALVATLFKRLELSTPNEALGLPSGSVRAAIALSLIVLFAIISITLFHSMMRPYVIKGVSADDADLIMKNTANKVVAVVSTKCVGPAPPPAESAPRNASSQPAAGHSTQLPVASAQTSKAGAASSSSGTDGHLRESNSAASSGASNNSEQLQGTRGTSQALVSSPVCFDMHLAQPPGQEAFDLAKQLLVLVGTLMTSVTSFYFASQAMAKAVELGKPSSRPDAAVKQADEKNSATNANVDGDKDSHRDGCGGPIAVVTPDTDLPPTTGGVA